MPTSAVIGGVASIAGAGLNFLGQESAAHNQQAQSQAALDFAKQQAAQQQANYEAQQAALKAQWDARQAALAPINAARVGMLNYYGFHMPAPTQVPYAPSATPTTVPIPNLAALLGIGAAGAGLAAWHPWSGPTSNPQMAAGMSPDGNSYVSPPTTGTGPGYQISMPQAAPTSLADFYGAAQG